MVKVESQKGGTQGVQALPVHILGVTDQEALHITPHLQSSLHPHPLPTHTFMVKVETQEGSTQGVQALPVHTQGRGDWPPIFSHHASPPPPLASLHLHPTHTFMAKVESQEGGTQRVQALPVHMLEVTDHQTVHIMPPSFILPPPPPPFPPHTPSWSKLRARKGAHRESRPCQYTHTEGDWPPSSSHYAPLLASLHPPIPISHTPSWLKLRARKGAHRESRPCQYTHWGWLTTKPFTLCPPFSLLPPPHPHLTHTFVVKVEIQGAHRESRPCQYTYWGWLTTQTFKLCPVPPPPPPRPPNTHTFLSSLLNPPPLPHTVYTYWEWLTTKPFTSPPPPSLLHPPPPPNTHLHG